MRNLFVQMGNPSVKIGNPFVQMGNLSVQMGNLASAEIVTGRLTRTDTKCDLA